MSREIVDANDGTLWIIEGTPGAYRARLAGPPTVDLWERKWELRNAIRHGDIVTVRQTVDVPGPDTLELPGMDGAWMPDPAVEPPFNSRLVGVLGRFGLASGAYADETPCSMEWVMIDAEAVIEVVRRGGDPAEALIDTGFWDPHTGPIPESLRADLVGACNG